MCEQCQAVDHEDDRDALAAAFYSNYGKPAPKPEQHALLNRKPTPVLPPKKAAR